MSKIVIIYTDGATEPNPGPGAWGAFLRWEHDGYVKELSGFDPATTNQIMELMGPIRALESLEARSIVKIFSDSQYVVKGITLWVKRWQANGWRTTAKTPVANKEVWVRLMAAEAKHQVIWGWVRGHDGDPGNVRADFIARQKLLGTLKDDREKFDAAVKGFSRHGDFDPAPYLEARGGPSV